MNAPKLPTPEEEFERVVRKLGEFSIEKHRLERERAELRDRERVLKVFLLECAAGDCTDPGQRATHLLCSLYGTPLPFQDPDPKPVEVLMAESVTPTAAALLGSTQAWDPGVRLIGNLTAEALGKLAAFALTAAEGEKLARETCARELEARAKAWTERAASGFYASSPQSERAARLRADELQVAAQRLRDGERGRVVEDLADAYLRARGPGGEA